jgi:hypothetical protein
MKDIDVPNVHPHCYYMVILVFMNVLDISLKIQQNAMIVHTHVTHVFLKLNVHLV